jgi:integrase
MPNKYPGVEKRGDGRWRARFRRPDGREESRTFTTETAARDWLDGQRNARRRGEWIDASAARIMVSEWWEEWRAGHSHLKPSTMAAYDSLWKTRIAPTWARVRLNGITNAAVARWVAKMRADGISASRTRQAYHLFGSMLDAAVRDRRIATNPAKGVKLPRLPQTERQYLTHEQLHTLAANCGPHELVVLVLGYTGLRWGEATALKVKRLDLMRGRIQIAEAVTEVNGELVHGTPKTHAARTVVVPGFLRDRLAEHVAGRDADDLVFAASNGAVLRVRNFRRGWFDRAARDAGVEGLVPHELRHTAASLAIASGASVKAVQAMLGHASATQTLDRYSHLWGDELDTVAERIDAAARAAFADRSRPERGLEVVVSPATFTH